MKVQSCFAAIGALCIGGCSFVTEIEGSGVAATETRNVGAFTGIEVAGSADVTVVPGADGPIEITADDNVLPLIETEVRNGKLTIGSKQSYNSKVDVKVKVPVKDISSVSIAGSGNIDLGTLSTDKMEISIAGSGSITGAGKAERLEVSIAGSGEVDLKELESKEAKVNIAGSGSIQVWATQDLEAEVTGSGEVRHKGNPRVAWRVVGSGSVERLGD